MVVHPQGAGSPKQQASRTGIESAGPRATGTNPRARCWLKRGAVPCHRDRGGDWRFAGLIVGCWSWSWNHPIDRLDRHSGLGRVLGRRWRGAGRLRLCGRALGLGIWGLEGAMGGMGGLFRCSRLGGRWRCGNSLHCPGHRLRRPG
jgi:hypothetical protein